MIPVLKSSNIAAIGYDEDQGELHVAFKSGTVYAYAGVEKAIHQKTLDAPSVGKFVSAEIVGKFSSRKLEPAAFTVTSRERGHNHIRMQGTFTGSATVEDVKKNFCNEHFGGRDAWVRDGQFGVIVHTD